MEEARKVVRERIESYPMGAVSPHVSYSQSLELSLRHLPSNSPLQADLVPYARLFCVVFRPQLHFSLLAITADPMPAIQRELKEAHEKGDEGAAAHAMMRLDDEERKRRKWAVSSKSKSLVQHVKSNFSPFLFPPWY